MEGVFWKKIIHSGRLNNNILGFVFQHVYGVINII